MTPAGATGTLLAVPNISEGRDEGRINAIAQAFSAGGARVLDVHADPDHHRSVFTLAAPAGRLAAAVAHGAERAIELIDLRTHEGAHPRVGAVDVAPIVYLDRAQRGAACAEALVLADAIGARNVPVFLFGALAGGRTRAELRRDGPAGLADRVAAGLARPDFGPTDGLHPSAGAVLVAARPPLIAFNLELAPPATLAEARAIAARIREGGPAGLPGLRAIGLWLAHEGVAQVSTNVEDHLAVPLAAVHGAVAALASVRRAEIVGLPPRAALAAFPSDVAWTAPVRVLEDVLSA